MKEEIKQPEQLPQEVETFEAFSTPYQTMASEAVVNPAPIVQEQPQEQNQEEEEKEEEDLRLKDRTMSNPFLLDALQSSQVDNAEKKSKGKRLTAFKDKIKKSKIKEKISAKINKQKTIVEES